MYCVCSFYLYSRGKLDFTKGDQAVYIICYWLFEMTEMSTVNVSRLYISFQSQIFYLPDMLSVISYIGEYTVIPWIKVLSVFTVYLVFQWCGLNMFVFYFFLYCFKAYSRYLNSGLQWDTQIFSLKLLDSMKPMALSLSSHSHTHTSAHSVSLLLVTS